MADEPMIPATSEHPAIYRDGHRLTANKPAPPRSARDGETRDPLLSPDGVRAAWAVVDRHHGPYRRVPMVELLTAYLNAASADPLLRPPTRDGETLSDAEVAAIRATALYASDHPELAAAEKVILRLCDAVAEAREDNDQYDQLNARLATILRLTANALKGEPDPLHHHSWHDLPEVATALRAQLADARAELKTVVDSVEDALFAMREPMTLGDARKGRAILTSYSVRQAIAAARAAAPTPGETSNG